MTFRIVRRIAASLLLIAVVATVLFFMLHLAPGDPTHYLAGTNMPPEARERLRELYGLDRPLLVQYGHWIANLARFDWGRSLATGRPATSMIAEAFPNTLVLALTAVFIDIVTSLTLALAAARWRDKLTDHLIRIGSLVVYSTPSFWLGLLAIYLFSYRLGWLPASSIASPGASSLGFAERLLDSARHLFLPAMVLGLSVTASTTRVLRNSLLETLGEDYVRTARSKGLSEARILGVHALRNALVPTIQLLGIRIPALLNGVLVVEVVFAWPGLGRVIFDAIQVRDYPLVLATTIFSSLLVVAGTLLADLLHAVVDPRVRRA